MSKNHLFKMKKNCAKIRIWRGDVSLNLIYIHKLLLMIMCFFVIQLSQTNTKNIRQIYCALKLVSRMCHWIYNDKNVLETSKYIFIFFFIVPLSFIISKKKSYFSYITRLIIFWCCCPQNQCKI